jgi:hypothetical protein
VKALNQRDLQINPKLSQQKTFDLMKFPLTTSYFPNHLILHLLSIFPLTGIQSNFGDSI